MKLILLSPQERKEHQIAWLEITTSVGNMVIQRGHAPMIVTIPAGNPITLCFQSGKQDTFVTPGGLLEIQRDHITFLSNE